jgi:C1A family cysteine protease
MAQRNCGSSYIFPTTSVLEERFCIHSRGKIRPILSQQDVLSCDTKHDKSDGGILSYTWEFLENVGTCSYVCKPYVSFDGSLPKCLPYCDNTIFNYFKWKAEKNYMRVIAKNHKLIKEQIYLNDPVTTFMETWEDIFAYKSGYYFHNWGDPSDAHAINIVGWGYDENYKRDYWIVRNSWGTDWENKDTLRSFLASIA